MGSMLEKITLYDILGYLLPGCLLETIVCLECMFEKWALEDGVLERIKEILEQFNSFFVVAFIIGGYCLGLILSECSAWANRKLGYENKIKYDNRAITDDVLKKAILSTGLVEEKELERRLRAKNTKNPQVIYGTLMYALFHIWMLFCGVIYVVGIGFLHSRYKKYCAKSQEYARVWFVEKYLK